MDAMVLKTQQWLNSTYGNDSRFNRVTEDGITGWGTIYGLRRALQIEEGITSTSNSFGPSTYSKCPDINEGDTGNLVYIVQGGLWCKGFNPGGFNGNYGSGTASAVKRFKEATGIGGNGNMNKDFMRALLDMSAFSTISGGKEIIRSVQQKLNRDYYDFYQISPCDGLYNREMNKMLIYALQKELGIAKASATGTWGPTTVSKCKEKTFSIGNSSNIVKLIRYALVCNGYNVDISSSVYDSKINYTCNKFANEMLISKPENTVGYSVIRSLMSSNGDTSRTAIGCDTATKLTSAQIQTLVNNGYRYVGRYVSNTPGGTLDKALTKTEVNNILSAGLKLFLIFQESGNSAERFNATTGAQNATTAISAVKNLGYSSFVPIYFAVDFDATDAQIKSNILPYFKAIVDTIEKDGNDFQIGVYGTRNVCTTVRNTYSEVGRLFISDASYGYSGNLGFTMPKTWSFDQFATDITIGSGDGKVSIDKVAVSGVDGCTFTPEDFGQGDTKEKIVYVTDEMKSSQGTLKVNKDDNGVRVYSSGKYLVNWGFDFIEPVNQKAILPKNAMYVELDPYDERYSLMPIKYLDQDGTIEYGFIMRKFGIGAFDIEIPKEWQENIYTYGLQRYFDTYCVSDDENDLVKASRVSINGHSCSIHRLRYDAKVYNKWFVLRDTIPAGTRVAITVSKTGKNHNETLPLYQREFDGQWINPLPDNEPDGAFIDYMLEVGCMPNDRLFGKE